MNDDKLHLHTASNWESPVDSNIGDVLLANGTDKDWRYCLSNFTPIWRHEGLSPCFYTVISDALLLVLMFPLLVQIRVLLK